MNSPANAVSPSATTEPAEQKRQILKARSQALAQPPREIAPPASLLAVVEFVLTEERYAIEASFVREVFPLRDYTPLPGTPDFILGVINMRGQIVSVVDIRKFFGLPQKGISDLNKVVIIRNPSMEFGILADAVVGARFIPTGDIQPSLPTLSGARAEYVRGISADSVVVLDAGKLLSDPKLVVEQETERP